MQTLEPAAAMWGEDRKVQHAAASLLMCGLLWCGPVSAQNTQIRCLEELSTCIGLIRFPGLSSAPSIDTMCGTGEERRNCRDSITDKCRDFYIPEQYAHDLSFYDYLCSVEGKSDYAAFDGCSLLDQAAACYHTYAEKRVDGECGASHDYVVCINRTCGESSSRFQNRLQDVAHGRAGISCEPIKETSVNGTDCSATFASCAQLISTPTPDCRPQSATQSCLNILQTSCQELSAYVSIMVQTYEYRCSQQGMEDFRSLAQCPRYSSCAEGLSSVTQEDICSAAREHENCTRMSCGEEAARFISHLQRLTTPLCNQGANITTTTPQPRESTLRPGPTPQTRCVSLYADCMNLIGAYQNMTSYCSSHSSTRRCLVDLQQECLDNAAVGPSIFPAVQFYEYACSSSGFQDGTSLNQCLNNSNEAVKCVNMSAELLPNPDMCSSARIRVSCLNKTCNPEATIFAVRYLEFASLSNGIPCSFGSSGPGSQNTTSSGLPDESQCEVEYNQCASRLSSIQLQETCNPQGIFRGCIAALKQRCMGHPNGPSIVAMEDLLEYICSQTGLTVVLRYNECQETSTCQTTFRTEVAMDMCRAAANHVSCTRKECGDQAAMLVTLIQNVILPTCNTTDVESSSTTPRTDDATTLTGNVTTVTENVTAVQTENEPSTSDKENGSTTLGIEKAVIILLLGHLLLH